MLQPLRDLLFLLQFPLITVLNVFFQRISILPSQRVFRFELLSPLEIPVKADTVLLKFWPLRPPSPSEFPMPPCGGGIYGYFQEILLSVSAGAINKTSKRNCLCKFPRKFLQYFVCFILVDCSVFGSRLIAKSFLNIFCQHWVSILCYKFRVSAYSRDRLIGE